MHKPTSISLWLLSLSLAYISCKKASVGEWPAEKLKITDKLATDPLDISGGCEFISWYNPETGIANPDNAITCWNSKPKHWPNLNMPNIPLPDWYLSDLPENTPQNSISMELKTFGAANYYSQRAINNFSESETSVGDFITTGDLGLTSEQLLFLDDHFALQTLVFDDYYTRFGESGALEIPQQLVDLFKLYCYFRSADDLFQMQANFFGQSTPGNDFATTLSTTELSQSFYLLEEPHSEQLQDLVDMYTVPVQNQVIGMHKLRLPRWYLYYYVPSADLGDFVILN